MCEHEWEFIREGNRTYFAKNKEGSFDFSQKLTNGHFKDYLCKKCKKARRALWGE